MVKKHVHYLFSPAMDVALVELAGTTGGSDTKTGWIEYCISDFIRRSLTGRICRAQLANCKTPDDYFRLYVKYVRAERKEDGYTFTNKDPAKRSVIGPGVKPNIKVTMTKGKDGNEISF